MARLRPLDAALVLTVGVSIAAAVWLGAREAAQGGVRKGRLELGMTVHQGIDPLRPPGMPQGARIDPDTGLLVGAPLAPGPGERALPWTDLRGANDVTGVQALPAGIRALAGQRVVMAGFVMALYRVRAMREFLLVGSHYTCCFGTPPGFGDQVQVRLAPAREPLDATPSPVRVVGTLQIEPEHLFEDGSGPLIGLFRLVDAEVTPYDG